MPNLYSEAMREAYASCPSDDVIYRTIELHHPDFVGDDGVSTSVFVVQDHEDLEARLEANAPVRGGELITFTRMAFEFKKPEVAAGAVPYVELRMDNVGRLMLEPLNRASVSNKKIVIRYREFLESTKDDQPEHVFPTDFSLSEIDVTPFAVTARASVSNTSSRRFPRRTYDYADFPAL